MRLRLLLTVALLAGLAHGEPPPDAEVWRVRAESLFWSVRAAPLPPLVTTGGVADDFPGALGQPGTSVLFGGSPVDFGGAPGGRLTVGWHNFEASAFRLADRTAGFGAAADAVGNPPLFVPVFRPELGREGRFRIGEPGAGLTGDVAAATRLGLWGMELNCVTCLHDHPNMRLGLLMGVRYLELNESLSFRTFSNDLLNLSTQELSDSFRTRNQFYGAQVGLRLGLQYGYYSLDVTGKFGFGSTWTTAFADGSTTVGGPGTNTPGTFPGGLFAQPSNSVRQEHAELTALPELQTRLGVRVTDHVKATLGYDLFRWGGAIRPGGLIDRRVNPSQTLGNPAAGSAAPERLSDRSDFLAYGVSFGIEVTY